jgi:hypothetical protein
MDLLAAKAERQGRTRERTPSLKQRPTYSRYRKRTFLKRQHDPKAEGGADFQKEKDR